jgi:hypothetical protein
METITITKEFLEQTYLKQLLKQEQIAKICNCSRRWIGKLMKKYNIPSRSRHSLYSIKINDLQKELIIASILGDGSVVKNGKHCRLQIAHGEKQKEYLLWKTKLLYPLAIQNPIKFHNNEWMTYTHNHLYFDQLRNQFYPKGKKEISDWSLLESVGIFGLAIWFMDDGTRGVKHSLQLIISSQSFSLKSHKNLQIWFQKKFELNPRILQYNSNNKRYCRIYFNSVDSMKLAKIISPYIIPSMRYKIANIVQEPVENIRLMNHNDDSMICAELHRNMQNIAEMTMSVN